MGRKGEPNKAADRLHLLENICGTKCKMRFFGPHCIDSEGGVMPFNAQMAVVSHNVRENLDSLRTREHSAAFEQKASKVSRDTQCREKQVHYTFCKNTKHKE